LSPPLTIFAADRTDIDWITGLYLDAATHGHFDINLADPQARALVTANLSAIVIDNCMPTVDKATQCMVFEQAGQRVGFVVMAEVRNHPGKIELHLMIVDPAWRGRRVGHRMFDVVLQRYHPHVDIYVRCYPVSHAMRRLLETHRFRVEASFDDHSTLYSLARAGAGNVPNGFIPDAAPPLPPSPPAAI
jgi:GNAT superfamily N-acetyltransferase